MAQGVVELEDAPDAAQRVQPLVIQGVPRAVQNQQQPLRRGHDHVRELREAARGRRR